MVVVGGGGWRWMEVGVVVGGPRRPREASSRAEILAWPPKSNPLPISPGALKLRLFVERLEKGKIKSATLCF